MNFEYKNKDYCKENSKISDFIKLLENVDDKALWSYYGLTVEIDPTVDCMDNTVLVRWFDIYEGFNDKIIFTNLASFLNEFHLIND